MQKRVVVTGMGIISPIGHGLDNVVDSLHQGKSGITRITQFDASKLRSQIAGEVKDFDPARYGIPSKEIKKEKYDLFTQYALASANMAFNDAKLEFDKKDIKRNIGVIVASGIGGIHSVEEQHKRLIQGGRLNPDLVHKMISDSAASWISIHYGLGGPVYCIVTACASSNDAISAAYYEFQNNKNLDMMVTGGSEAAITPFGVGGFDVMRALASEKSCPFDLKRDGFVIAEGSAILVLEELNHALKRKAPIYGEIIGCGRAADAYHITAPAPDAGGMAYAMHQAIENAGIKPEDIDYINAHGTSTKFNDKSETLAIKNVLKDYAYKVDISSTKSMTGHALGAAGSIESVFTLLAMKHGFIPPTINYNTPDPDCDLNYTPNKIKEKKINIAMSNTFGFGGKNSVIIYKKFNG